MTAPWLTVIGVGEGGYGSISPEALMALDHARHVFAPQRLAEAFDLSGKTVEVWSSKVKEPVAVRLAWREDALHNLANKAGFPASTFRTDRWAYTTP